MRALEKQHSNKPAGSPLRPGPFGTDPSRRRGSDIGAALGTSLLVMYPVIATVAALIAGIAASSSHGLG